MCILRVLYLLWSKLNFRFKRADTIILPYVTFIGFVGVIVVVAVAYKLGIPYSLSTYAIRRALFR